MNFKICSIVIISLFAVVVCDPNESCPDFSATFVMIIDQTILMTLSSSLMIQSRHSSRRLGLETMTFNMLLKTPSNSSTQHMASISHLTSIYMYFFENATMNRYRVANHIRPSIVLSNWIQTGSTHLTCRRVTIGEFSVRFSGDQLLHGSYGGADGIPVASTVESGSVVAYGFIKIDVCDQSPVIIKVQHHYVEYPLTDQFPQIYNNVLGHEKAYGSDSFKVDQKNPGKFRLLSRMVYTFFETTKELFWQETTLVYSYTMHQLDFAYWPANKNCNWSDRAHALCAVWSKKNVAT